MYNYNSLYRIQNKENRRKERQEKCFLEVDQDMAPVNMTCLTIKRFEALIF